MITGRSDTDPLNLDTNELLDILNVRPCLLRKVVVALCASSGLFPPRKSLVVNLNFSQHLRVGGEALELLTLVRIRSRDLELFEII